MISVVLWKWATPGYRSQYTGEHVNAAARMCRRWYRPDLRVICVTNDDTGIDGSIDVIPDREDFSDLKSPHGIANPSCYRRLLAFHPDAAQWFGERFVSIDLDFVAVADLAPVWYRPEDFVAWRDPFHGARGQYCGSMFLLRAGSHPEVWERFAADPRGSQVAAAQAGFRGSDQAWISHAARGAPTWSTKDGVYSFRVDFKEGALPLPKDARAVMFHGRFDPWHDGPQSLPWVKANWGVGPPQG